jgi:hypothetical protein
LSCYFCRLNLENHLRNGLRHLMTNLNRKHHGNSCYRELKSLGLDDKDYSMSIWSKVDSSLPRCLHLNIVEYLIHASKCDCQILTRVYTVSNSQLCLKERKTSCGNRMDDGFIFHSPGITKAANPRIFFKPVIPRMKGKNSNSFNLKSFRMTSIGMNIFLILCLTVGRKMMKTFLQSNLIEFTQEWCLFILNSRVVREDI